MVSLPSTIRASWWFFPVEKPLAEKKEIREFQVTEEAMKSTPLLMKWPLSFRVDGSSPKVRAMEPRSSLCSSHTTNHTAFDTKGQNSLMLLCLLLSPPSLSLSLCVCLSRLCGSCLTISVVSFYCAMVLTASGIVFPYSLELVSTTYIIIIIIINFLLFKKKKKTKQTKTKTK